jgi:hypothetical protein
MHVACQSYQWLGTGIGKSFFVCRKWSVHFFHTEASVPCPLKYFLDEHIERQSLDVATGFDNMAGFGDDVELSPCNVNTEWFPRVPTV